MFSGKRFVDESSVSSYLSSVESERCLGSEILSGRILSKDGELYCEIPPSVGGHDKDFCSAGVQGQQI